MACCIALAMVIAFARGAWSLLIPRRRGKVPQDFAPVAHRPAPTETPTTVRTREQGPAVRA
jgi:hypothetical protein